MTTPETDLVLVRDSNQALHVYNKRGHAVLIEDAAKREALISVLETLSVPVYSSIEEFRKEYPGLRGYRQVLVRGPKDHEIVRLFVDWHPHMPYSSATKPYAIGYLRDLISTYVGYKPHNTYLSEHHDTISAVVVIEGNDFPQSGYDLRGIAVPLNKEGFAEL
jgi:hypothetical protein